MEKYKRSNDTFQFVKEVIRRGEEGENADETISIADSAEMVCIDLAFPSVMINRAQKNKLDGLTTPGTAARHLIDFLFEEEEYDRKNYSTLKRESPEKIATIMAYCVGKYKCQEPVISKAITGKCTGR